MNKLMLINYAYVTKEQSDDHHFILYLRITTELYQHI